MSSPEEALSDSTMEFAVIKNVPIFVYVLDTVICSLNSIWRLLVLWLGPLPVNQVSLVQISQKSLVAYFLLKFLKEYIFS